MAVYHAPLRDMRFVLHELHGSEPDGGEDGFAPDLLDSVLDEAAKLAETVLLPLRQSGDAEGCALENGAVRTPRGFDAAYRRFCEGGWQGLSCDPGVGGQGLPERLHKLVEEMLCSANLAFSLFPVLTHGAILAMRDHADATLRARFLPKLVEGRWSGTMCLTEAQCGTDLGLLRTRAIPQDDGAYRITGTKIFITGGEHGLAENIVHFVLARLPDAPAGTRGISLFLVPKFVPREDGSPGARNGVVCTAIERKMGIHGVPTCALSFEDATGWLVGEPHRGLPAMFTMMNGERLSVGIQGVGIAEAAYQAAAAYARERLQGRAPGGARHPDRSADPILVHPDVRRMLLTMRAHAEGCRALSGWVAWHLDAAAHAADARARQASEDFLALLTPVVKALFTDLGFEAASLGVQVLGGHGYIRDHGMEQLLRDARIAMLYEGTNGVQAMDLVGRKLPAAQGRLLDQFREPVADFIAAHAANAGLAPYVQPLGSAFGRLQSATRHILEADDPAEPAAAAAEYLRLFGLVALGFMWARAAQVALPRVQAGDEAAFYRAKLATARFYMQRILPQADGLHAAIMAGGSSIAAFEDAAF